MDNISLNNSFDTPKKRCNFLIEAKFLEIFNRERNISNWSLTEGLVIIPKKFL